MASGFKQAKLTKVSGAQEILKELEKRSILIADGLAAALYQEGLAIMRVSVRECPVDFGVLRASHYVAPPKNNRNPICEIGYGTKYAEAVHEIQEANHVVGKYHFLRDPVQDAQGGYAGRLARRAWDNHMRNVQIGTVSTRVNVAPIVREVTDAQRRRKRANKKKRNLGG